MTEDQKIQALRESFEKARAEANAGKTTDVEEFFRELNSGKCDDNQE